jgi:hypothetical protein
MRLHVAVWLGLAVAAQRATGAAAASGLNHVEKRLRNGVGVTPALGWNSWV